MSTYTKIRDASKGDEESEGLVVSSSKTSSSPLSDDPKVNVIYQRHYGAFQYLWWEVPSLTAFFLILCWHSAQTTEGIQENVKFGALVNVSVTRPGLLETPWIKKFVRRLNHIIHHFLHSNQTDTRGSASGVSTLRLEGLPGKNQHHWPVLHTDRGACESLACHNSASDFTIYHETQNLGDAWSGVCGKVFHC